MAHICLVCNRLHKALPASLIPHKYYEAEIIRDVIDEAVTAETIDAEIFSRSAEITLARWITWFERDKMDMERINMFKISIITPIYNAERFLVDTIESFIHQSYGNLEIILVNDGSIDNSQDIIDSYKDKDNRIISIITENHGAPHARNVGLQASRGDFILFFDADDVMELNAVEKLLDAWRTDIDLVIGSNIKIKEDGARFRKEIVNSGEYTIPDDSEYILHVNPFPNTKLYSAKIIRENGLSFSDVKIAQDINFFYKYLLHSKKIAMISDIICFYRIVENSVSHTYNLNALDIIKCTRDIEEYALAYSKSEVFMQALYNEIIRHCNFQLSKVYKMQNKEMKIAMIDGLYEYMSEIMVKIKEPKASTIKYYDRICRFKREKVYYVGKVYSTTQNFYWKVRAMLIDMLIKTHIIEA